MNVVAFPIERRVREVELTKKQVAAEYGRTTRWVELRVAEGMPSTIVGGKRRFLLSQVRKWLAEREANGAS